MAPPAPLPCLSTFSLASSHSSPHNSISRLIARSPSACLPGAGAGRCPAPPAGGSDPSSPDPAGAELAPALSCYGRRCTPLVAFAPHLAAGVAAGASAVVEAVGGGAPLAAGGEAVVAAWGGTLAAAADGGASDADDSGSAAMRGALAIGCRVLARHGARLVLPERCLKAAEEARVRLRGECPGAGVVVLPLDLSSLASVRLFFARFLALGLPLNLPVNNAVSYAHRFAVTKDSVEMTFATNFLGHFLLMRLLLEKLAETARATGIVDGAPATPEVHSPRTWSWGEGRQTLASSPVVAVGSAMVVGRRCCPMVAPRQQSARPLAIVTAKEAAATLSSPLSSGIRSHIASQQVANGVVGKHVF
ncbi:hypothetical protein ACP4OV_024378 [Aristida adscensionis]